LGERVSVRRCWYCSIDDIGQDGWVAARGRVVCADCNRALLEGGLPYARVAASYRGRAGSPRRTLGEVYQALVAFKERREGWPQLVAPLARGLESAVRRVAADEGLAGVRGWILAPVPSFRGRRPHVRILTALAAVQLPAADLRLDLLAKTVDFVQKGLSWSERRLESAGAYAIRGHWGSWGDGGRSVRGRAIVITDDFMTTGATFDACARVLMDAGASVVYGAAVVRVLRAPGVRVLTLGARQVSVQMRELDARGRAVVSAEDGTVWVRFACSAKCPAIHTAGPYDLPSFDRRVARRWVCRCGASHDVRMRREWLGESRECLAVGVGARRPAELLVGIVQGTVAYV